MPSSRGENGPCYRVLLSQPWRIRLVPLAGLEPARCFHHLILSQARLPIPPQGLERRIIAANARGSTARCSRPSFETPAFAARRPALRSYGAVGGQEVRIGFATPSNL